MKGKLEAFSSTCPEYVQLCNRANQFLLQRESEQIVRAEETKKFDFKEIESKLRKKKDEAEKVNKYTHLQGSGFRKKSIPIVSRTIPTLSNFLSRSLLIY